MIRRPSPRAQEVAQRLLEHELGAGQSPAALVEAGNRVCQRLFDHLSWLIGRGGVLAIFGRSLQWAKEDFPFLSMVSPNPKDGCFSGLQDGTAELDTSLLKEGLTAILAKYIWLLVSLMGEDLALGQIARVWPDVPLNEPVSGAQEDEE